jgi:hypothetical protein
MTNTELYNQLADKSFQDPMTGNLFFPAYMYVYNPAEEYQVQQEIWHIKERLHRPDNYLNVLVIDIFQEFLAFLKAESFGRVSKYEFYLSQESQKPEKVSTFLKQDANSAAFFQWLNQRIQQHFHETVNAQVAYVFMMGFGAIFPYLRASKFMNNFEKYIANYKIILFYPGEVKENYNLFKLLNDENLYRAIHLINQ